MIADIEQLDPGCQCGSALQNALISAPDTIPKATYEKLELLIKKYISPPTEQG
jgi:hypothetical protein